VARALVLAVVAGLLLGAASPADGTERLRLRVEGMVCPFCAASVESVLGGQAGVLEAEASFLSGTAVVVYDPARIDPEAIVAAVNSKTLYRARLVGADEPWVPPGTVAGAASVGWPLWAVVVLLVALAVVGLTAWRRRAGPSR
jgi:copper chaperone CopZ